MLTARELGLEVELAQYRFLTAPKGTTEEVKERLVEGLEATFQTEEYQQFDEQNTSRADRTRPRPRQAHRPQLW